MAELDKLIEKMVHSNVHIAMLEDDQPMRLFSGQNQFTGSVIPKAALQSILQEITPPNLYSRLSQDGSFHFPYNSPYGFFDIDAVSDFGRVHATISPVVPTLAVPAPTVIPPNQPIQPRLVAKPTRSNTWGSLAGFCVSVVVIYWVLHSSPDLQSALPDGVRAIVPGLGKDLVKEDLLSYSEQNEPLDSLEEDSINAYNSVVGEGAAGVSDDQAYKVIAETAMPKYREFVNKLDSIQPATPEVKRLHEVYLSAANKQLNGMIDVMAAIEKQDTSLMADANTRMAEGKKEIREYKNELNELASQHDLVITKND